jgi:cellulose synthase/poly-beta-1,6-N-acetylglucosamine synthase-like glycosyltransferase
VRTVCSVLAAFASLKGRIAEKRRRQYHAECGVPDPPAYALRPTYCAWALYSFLRLPATIKGHHLKQRGVAAAGSSAVEQGMNNPPTISIVTAFYNGMPQIRRTLESLRQQSVPFEHLVMDACSKDGTADAASEYVPHYNVTVISEKDEDILTRSARVSPGPRVTSSRG